MVTWLPLTHGDYAAEYDENWEYLGIWNGMQTWAVPDYVDPSIVPSATKSPSSS